MSPKRTILTVLLLSAALPAGPAAASPDAPRAPAPDQAQPRERLELRAELYRAGGRDRALPQPRFRALCDDRGFPLVGNVATKGSRYHVSEYCADVRKRPAPGTPGGRA
ncbi:MAG: hypothetical protein HS111_30370 [Kofleriaceae bacterium]|nr:hypothetical protein [Kofleriaceae bacterium]MCL4224633.1 hypothetical protein [Myxococcales bacterium]